LTIHWLSGGEGDPAHFETFVYLAKRAASLTCHKYTTEYDPTIADFQSLVGQTISRYRIVEKLVAVAWVWCTKQKTRSFKKFSTIAESFSTRQLVRSPNFNSAEPWRCSATR